MWSLSFGQNDHKNTFFPSTSFNRRVFFFSFFADHLNHLPLMMLWRMKGEQAMKDQRDQTKEMILFVAKKSRPYIHVIKAELPHAFIALLCVFEVLTIVGRNKPSTSKTQNSSGFRKHGSFIFRNFLWRNYLILSLLCCKSFCSFCLEYSVT